MLSKFTIYTVCKSYMIVISKTLYINILELRVKNMLELWGLRSVEPGFTVIELLIY